MWYELSAHETAVLISAIWSYDSALERDSMGIIVPNIQRERDDLKVILEKLYDSGVWKPGSGVQ